MTIENILQNEELLQALAAAENVHDLEAVLAQYGIKLEEGLRAEELLQMLKNPGKDGELNEADLDDVNGGILLLPVGPSYGITRATAWIIAQWLKRRKK